MKPDVETSLRFETVDRLDALDPAEHSRLARPAGVYQTRGWLEASERMATGPVRYVVARDPAGRMAGLLPLYLFPGGDDIGLYDPAATLGRDSPLLALPTQPLARFGSRSGYLSGWSIALDYGPAEAARLAGLLFIEGCRVATGLGATLLSLQFLPRDQAALLAASGTVDPEEFVLQEPQARLPVPRGGFDAYLGQLSSGRRWNVRHDLRLDEQAGCVNVRMRLSQALDFAPALIGNVQARHGLPDDPDRLRRVLATQAGRLDEESLVVASLKDGRPIACSYSYLDGETLYVRAAGLDHAATQGTGAYFSVTFYEPIRYAGERDARWVHLGIGSLGPKLTRGARPEPLFGVFRRADGTRISSTDRDRLARSLVDRLRAELGTLWPSDFEHRLRAPDPQAQVGQRSDRAP